VDGVALAGRVKRCRRKPSSGERRRARRAHLTAEPYCYACLVAGERVEATAVVVQAGERVSLCEVHHAMSGPLETALGGNVVAKT
jgi:hypothetical protein